MVQLDEFWLKDCYDIFDVTPTLESEMITWKSSLYDNFIQMAETFFSCAHSTLVEIVEASHDNMKSDMWFLAGMYLYRQAIELLCKALILPFNHNNDEITRVFKSHKHNIESLFCAYVESISSIPISTDEQWWLSLYLKNIEEIDKNSDLFRYPFKDAFIQKYKNSFLDIIAIANGMEQAYAILFKCVDVKHTPLKYQDDIDCSMSTEFLYFSSHGIGNCQIYDSPWCDGFYKQIEGYSNVAAFVCKNDTYLSKQQLFFPVAFLLRNAIELALKRLLISRTEYCVERRIQISKRNSHLLYKDLWGNVKPLVSHYVFESEEDLEQIRIADDYLKRLDTIDKRGDAFRYPVNYGLQYRFNKQVFNLDTVHSWLQGVFNFLDGCDSMLSAVYDYECEIRSSIISN